jgi:hypothetical protein
MSEFETFRTELFREQNECAEQQRKNIAEKAEQVNKLNGFFDNLYHHLQSENIPLEKIEYMKDPETEVVVEKKGSNRLLTHCYGQVKTAL